MKTFSDMKNEQQNFCSGLYIKAYQLAQKYKGNKDVCAILLTGSVARGDAQSGRYIICNV